MDLSVINKILGLTLLNQLYEAVNTFKLPVSLPSTALKAKRLLGSINFKIKAAKLCIEEKTNIVLTKIVDLQAQDTLPKVGASLRMLQEVMNIVKKDLNLTEEITSVDLTDEQVEDLIEKVGEMSATTARKVEMLCADLIEKQAALEIALETAPNDNLELTVSILTVPTSTIPTLTVFTSTESDAAVSTFNVIDKVSEEQEDVDKEQEEVKKKEEEVSMSTTAEEVKEEKGEASTTIKKVEEEQENVKDMQEKVEDDQEKVEDGQ